MHDLTDPPDQLTVDVAAALRTQRQRYEQARANLGLDLPLLFLTPKRDPDE